MGGEPGVDVAGLVPRVLHPADAGGGERGSGVAKRLGGQFFTDQRVTRLAVDLLEYDPAKHDFVDICSGTGGFLIAAAAAYVRTRVRVCARAEHERMRVEAAWRQRERVREEAA